MTKAKKPTLPTKLYLTLPRSTIFSGFRERWVLERVPEDSVNVWQQFDLHADGRYQSVTASFDEDKGWEISVRVPGPWRLRTLDSLVYRSAPVLIDSRNKTAGTLTFRGPRLAVKLFGLQTFVEREDGNEYPVMIQRTKLQGAASSLEIEVCW